MHIDNMDDFEELVNDIKSPLLFLFVTRWCDTNTDWSMFDRYKKYINIIKVNVSNMPELCAIHGLYTPSMALYKDGGCVYKVNGLPTLYLRDIIYTYGEFGDELYNNKR